MENEIYISKLNSIIKEVEAKYKLDIFFVEIFGKRYSFIAGNNYKIKVTQYIPIKINEKIGVVFPSDINENLKNEILDYIINYLNVEEGNGMQSK